MSREEGASEWSHDRCIGGKEGVWVLCSVALKPCCMKRELANVWILGRTLPNSLAFTTFGEWIEFPSCFFLYENCILFSLQSGCLLKWL